MIRQIMSLILFLALAAGVFMTVTHTPWVLRAAVPALSAARLEAMGMTMEDFDISRQSLEGLKTLILDDVTFTLHHGEAAYEVRIARVVLPNIRESWNADAQIQVGLGQVRIHAPGLELQGAQARLAVIRDEAGWLKAIEGLAQGVDVAYQGYAFYQGQGRFHWDAHQLQIVEAVFGVGGGQCTGQATFSYAPEESVLVWMEMSGVPLEKVAWKPGSLLRDAAGTIFGTLRVSISRGQLDVVDVQVSLPQGGRIKEELLRRLRAQIDPELAAQLPGTEALWFDRAVVRLRGGVNQPPRLGFQIVNRAYDVNIEKLVPVRLDGGWLALLAGGE